MKEEGREIIGFCLCESHKLSREKLSFPHQASTWHGMEWIDIEESARKSRIGTTKHQAEQVSLLVSGRRRVLLRPETRTWPELPPEPCHVAVKTLPPVPSRYVKAKKRFVILRILNNPIITLSIKF